MKKLKLLLVSILFIAQISNAQTDGDQLFNEDVLHEIYIEGPTLAELETRFFNELFDGNYTYFLSKVTIDGVVIDSVGVRMKGGSSILDLKKPLKLDFNTFKAGQEYDGVKKLNLHNFNIDSSFQRELSSYDVMRTAGLKAPRTAVAQVYLNNQLQGVYGLVEQIDKNFLRNYFANDEGTLVKSGQIGFDLKSDTGSVSLYTDLKQFVNSTPNTILADTIEKVLDVDGFFKQLILQNIIGTADNLFQYEYNFYLYQEPKSQIKYFIPWDLNLSFLPWLNAPINRSPQNAIATKLLQITKYRTLYFQIACEMLDYNFTEERLFPLLNKRRNLIRNAIANDPYVNFSIAEFDAKNEVVKTWITNRNADLKNQLLMFGCQPLNDVGFQLISINEIMASSDSLSGNPDPAGDYPDWIELYNGSTGEVDLSGWYLSNDKDFKKHWKFPKGTTIGADSYLIVWADRDVDEEGLHTDFKLSKGGGEVFLSHEKLRIIDSVDFPAQNTNIAYSRLPNGVGDFVFQDATFNKKNGSCNDCGDYFSLLGRGKDYDLCLSDSVFFEVEANCENLNYQWAMSSDTINWEPIFNFSGDFSGVNSPILRIVNNIGKYEFFYFRCKISDRCSYHNSDKFRLIYSQPPPASSFSFTQNQDSFYFQNNSQNDSIITWVFENQNISNLQNPNLLFEQAGEQEVKLIATNDCKSDSLIQKITVPELTGDFTLNVSNGCAPLTVDVSAWIDVFRTNDLKISWKNGNLSGEAIGQNTSFTLTEPGSYDFILEIDGPYGEKFILEKTSAVEVFAIQRISLQEQICEGETISIGNQIFSTTGIFQIPFTNQNGCDSIVELTLEILPVYFDLNEIQICEEDSYQFADTLLTTGGYFQKTFQNRFGCDSTEAIQLTVNATSSTSITQSRCEGESIIVAGQEFFTTGNYEIQLQNQTGCDSTIQLSLQVFPKYFNEKEIQICNGTSFQFGDTTLTTEGYFAQELQSQNGCDSVEAIQLTVSNSFIIPVDYTLCFGDSISIGNQTFSTSGKYEILFQSQTGCDSLVQLDLEVLPYESSHVFASICMGGSYQLIDTTLTDSGIHEVILTTQYGCDSLVIIDLIFAPSYDFKKDTSICEGDTLNYLGQNYTMPGEYGFSYQSAEGCDSLETLALTILEIKLIEIDTVIRAGEFFEGILVQQDTSFQKNLIAQNGCDSIVQIQIIADISATNSLMSDIGVELFPNPTNGNAVFKTKNPLPNSGVLLFYNTLGQPVFEQPISKNSNYQKLEIQALSSGIYFTVLKIEGDSFLVGKMIVE